MIRTLATPRSYVPTRPRGVPSDRPPSVQGVKYEILDTEGGCHRTIECRDIALEVLLDLVAEDPDAVDRFEILETDDEGEVRGCIDVDSDLFEALAR